LFPPGAAELCENGGRLAPLSKLSWEVRGADDKPLLHIWSEQYNLTRRVIAITDHSDARLVLAVERFGRSGPDRLEFVRIDFERSARELSREEFCERLRGSLASQFPDETVESATISADFPYRRLITGYECAAVWSLVSLAAMVISLASKFKKRHRWFIWLLPRCVFIQSRAFCWMLCLRKSKRFAWA
jgi:hypothetical protein